MTIDTDLVWMAGFFDGEGSIFPRANGTWPALAVCVTQLDPEPLELYHARFGGFFTSKDNSLYAGAGWRVTWEWKAYSAKATAALTELRPYLRVKAVQADAALAYAATMGGKRAGKALDPILARKRQKLLDNWSKMREDARIRNITERK